MKLFYSKQFIAAISVALVTLPAFSQNSFRDSSFSSPHKLSAYPVVYYTPETSLAFGAGGAYVLKRDTIARHIRIDNFQFIAAYTLNDQILVQSSCEFWPRSSKYLIQGNLGYFKYPYLFFGVGNSVTPTISQEYSATYSQLHGAIFRRLVSRFYAGISMWYEDYYEVDYQKDGFLENSHLPGLSGGRFTGVGPAFRFDSRDDAFFPTRGWYTSLSLLLFGQAIFSDYTFNRAELDIRKYWPLGGRGRAVLAGQLLTRHVWGDVPFQMLAKLGGQRYLRGYYEGAYRDNHNYSAQLEWRKFVLPRWGFAVFAGVGTVQGHRDFWSLLPSGGAGLRFLLNRAQNINLRVDYAAGANSSGIYVNVTEAF